MGYSCTAAANQTHKTFLDNSFGQTGIQGSYKHKGNIYFEEIGRENKDGAITGSIYLVIDKLCYKKGSYRIEPSGTITRGSYGFKNMCREV